MSIFQLVLKAFLLPGNLVIRHAGISVEQDGGILRSFVNMCVWGVTAILFVFYFV